jgi:hypothetical protein
MKLIMKLIYQFLFIVVEKVYLVFYSREDDFVSRAAGEWRNSSEPFRIWTMPRQEEGPGLF